MKCERCSCKTNIWTGSWFNEQRICITCSEIEQRHPDIKKAKDADLVAVKQGNYNFRGIGLPKGFKNE